MNGGCRNLSNFSHVLQRSYGFVLLVALIFVAGPVVSQAASGETNDSDSSGTDHPPSIVLILADDLGWTDLECFGSDLYESQNIDRLAAEGMTFTASYAACHVCSPTRASIMTGQYPARLHLTDFIAGGRDRGLRSPEWTKHLPLEETTIAEVLGERGYVCGHFGKWHLNKDKNYRSGRPMDPASQGFDDVLTTVKPKRGHPPTEDPHNVAAITDRAVAFIERNKDRPFFCYVTHNIVHRPEIARPEVVEQYQQKVKPSLVHENATYAAMVHDLDRSVGRILDQLEESGLADRALVVFTSDNGGLTGDDQDRGTSNAPLRGGKGTNYEGGVRVPTIVRWPGVVKAGSVSDEPIISMDFFNTLAEVGGADAEQIVLGVDGVSLLPLLRNPRATLDREALFWHYPHYHSAGATPHGAIRRGPWKLIEFYEDDHVELYHLENDVGEQNNLADDKSGLAANLRRQLHEWRDRVDAQMPLPAE